MNNCRKTAFANGRHRLRRITEGAFDCRTLGIYRS
jgi:hypothetical protein